ncbi:MAG: cell division protein ZapA [Pseudomonadota bacterium]
MAKADIEVFGRRYSVACAPGQESRLMDLGVQLDARINKIAEAVGDVGDDRLLLVAALSLLDELEAAKAAPTAELEAEMARVLSSAATRIDAVIDRVISRSSILPEPPKPNGGDTDHAQ